MIILIPMAGKGKRFKESGYKEPKPLIDVCGKPMINRALACFPKSADFIFIVRKENYKLLKPYLNGKVIQITKDTEGATCTALLAGKYLKGKELIIANCDQYLKFDWKKFIKHARKYDGCLMTFNSTNPHHSYAKIIKKNVIEVAEKIVISDHASAGFYYFKYGEDFVWAAEEMIKKNIRTNNEFYICPVYNELIKMGMDIGIWEIDVNNKHMLGTPYELQIFIDKVNNKEVKL